MYVLVEEMSDPGCGRYAIGHTSDDEGGATERKNDGRLRQLHTVDNTSFR